MTQLQIDIVSDVACPWCAIGYKRLEQAMEALAGEFSFTGTWYPFQLNPDQSAEGEPILDSLCRKYGKSAGEIERTQDEIIAIAQGLGLNFTRARERRAHNTFDAHRLIAWARGQNKATELNMALFDVYFGHALNPSDPEVLRQAAEAAGLDGETASEVIASDAHADEVRSEEAFYKQAGVTGVPAFIINGSHLVSGAQEPETLIQAFRQISREQQTDAAKA